MERIQKKDRAFIVGAFSSVFRNNNPFGEMFQKSIKERLILCPIEGYYFSKNQFSALIKAAELVGDINMYLSEIEGFSGSNIGLSCYKGCHQENWILDILVTYEQYTKIPLVLENALYSPCGKWGAMVSHEEHAVIGGNKEFINVFKKFYPEWSNDQENFIKKWNYNRLHYDSNLDWLPTLIDHIYKP